MKLKPIGKRGNLTWLSFIHADQTAISLEFAFRLAAYAEYVGMKLVITSGNRSVAKQALLYAENVRKYPPNGNGGCAKPGRSWHNAHCAIDIHGDESSEWYKYIVEGDYKRTIKKQELYKFGLCCPMNRVDSNGVYEWWHIQPIETLSYNGVNRVDFLDDDDLIYGEEDGTMTIDEFQAIHGLTPDGIVGPATLKKAQECLECIGMIFDSPNYESNNIIINSVPVKDVKTVTMAGSTYVKIKPVLEAVGKKVAWDGKTKSVIVT